MKRIFARFVVGCLLLGATASAADRYSARWREVADHLITASPSEFPFNWGEGVQMIGLMKVYERTGDERYADYVARWADQYLAKDVRELLDIGPQPRGERPGYCGYWSPATAILALYDVRRRPDHLMLARNVAAFVRDGAERSPEGALGHWLGSHQLWVDTLYMACPLLAGLGRLEDKPDEINDAADQLLLYAKRLQDQRTGLFYHMWDWQTGERTPALWGRGNGWVILSIADTMEVLPEEHPAHRRLKSIAGKLADGLRQTQDDAGLWHTVMDDPDSYTETSASMMATYGLLKLVRLEVLPVSFVAVARKAWSAVNERFVRDGVVSGVSAGTDPDRKEYYRKRPVSSQTWGTGAYLMAGSEVARLE